MAISIIARALTISACLLVVGCGTPDPIPYVGLESTSHLMPASKNGAGMRYRYVDQVDWRVYNRIIIEPVLVYKGADGQFGDLSAKDRELLAGYMQKQFTDALQKRFALSESSGANTLRLRLTLTGAAASTPGLSTLSRFDMAGGLYNGVQGISGGEGTFTGAVIYAVEIYDSRSKRLLAAYIAKQYPNAFDLSASFGALDAAKAGIDKGAAELAEQLK